MSAWRFFACFAWMTLGFVLIALCVAGLVLHPEQYKTLDLLITLALILLTSLAATGAVAATKGK
ncbi:membrane protein [Arthrobacter phage Rizwana]|nr:membrane protein [Arthrobacter phage Rizwana]